MWSSKERNCLSFLRWQNILIFDGNTTFLAEMKGTIFSPILTFSHFCQTLSLPVLSNYFLCGKSTFHWINCVDKLKWHFQWRLAALISGVSFLHCLDPAICKHGSLQNNHSLFLLSRLKSLEDLSPMLCHEKRVSYSLLYQFIVLL